MNQITMDIEQLKKAAREKFTAENNKYLWTTVTEQIDEINPFIDEIVTSTYLQAVEDVKQIANQAIREQWTLTNFWLECAKLQSLKQTKDV